MVSNSHYDHIIIGAGIAGLSLAYKLKRAGANFLLIEKSKSVGGSWQSHDYKSSIYEFGPNSFMNRCNELEEMIDEIGFRDQVISHSFKDSKRYLYHKDKLIEVGSNPLTVIKSDLLSLNAKLNILREPLQSLRPANDESVYDFISRRFNDETADIVSYALQGIWAGDTHKLSAKAAIPKLIAMEEQHGSILKALFNKMLNDSPVEQTEELKSCSFINGMQGFCEALAGYIGHENIKLKAEGSRLQASQDRNNCYTIKADRQEFTTPNLTIASQAFAASKLVKPLSKLLSQKLRSIYYAPIILFAYTLPKSLMQDHERLNAFGLISGKDKHVTLGTIFSSQLFPERKLEDEYLMLCFAGGARHSEIIDYDMRELRYRILQEQIEILNPLASRKLRLDHFNLIDYKIIEEAIPQYNIGYLDTMAVINSELENYPGLNLIGNYIGGVSLTDTIKNSFKLYNTMQETPDVKTVFA